MEFMLNYHDYFRNTKILESRLVSILCIVSLSHKKQEKFVVKASIDHVFRENISKIQEYYVVITIFLLVITT